MKPAPANDRAQRRYARLSAGFVFACGMACGAVAQDGRGDTKAPAPRDGAEATPDPSDAPGLTAAPEESADASLFLDPEDGAFDLSAFLDLDRGFLPVAMPITEPAVGYGAAVALAFFHDPMQIKPTRDGTGKRVALPSTTFVLGGATENGTWMAGGGHYGSWNEDRVRYLGVAGYGALNLDWYGKGNAFDGKSIAYENDVLFILQRVTFQLGDSDFYAGPVYRLMDSNATFQPDTDPAVFPPLVQESTISGVGAAVSFDNRDHPFRPRRGGNVELTLTQQDRAWGSDYDYWLLATNAAVYFPLQDRLTLGVRVGFSLAGDEAPFNDLPGITLRGIPLGRYVDNAMGLAEVQLNYDLTERWTVLGFVGAGRVADNVDDLFSATDRVAGGAGFRYLIARTYGIQMGCDVAVGPDDGAFYISVGTGFHF